MTISRHGVTALAVTCALLALAGCNNTTAVASSISITRASATISAGKTLQLGLVATSGVTWTVDEGAAGGTVDTTGLYTAPATPGVYHVTATLQSDASKKASATVTVVAPAGVPVITVSVASATPGQTGLTASVPAVAGTTYLWRLVGGGTISAGGTTASITFTAGDAGEVVIGCTLTNAAGDSGAEGVKVLTVANPLVPPPAEPVILGVVSPVVAGATGLTASVASPEAALTYAWTLTGGGSITAGASTSSVTFSAPAEPSVFTLSVTATNAGGTSPAATKDITVLPLSAPAMPIITGLKSPVTAGATELTAMVAEPDPSLAYAWTLDNGGTITSGADTDAIVFNASPDPTTMTLTLTATNSTGTSPPALALIDVIDPPTTPQIRAPVRVTAGRDGLTASVPNLDGKFTHVWTVTGAVVTSPSTTPIQTDHITFTAGTGDITLSVVESNQAGDSADPATATVLVSPVGVELVAGQLGGHGNIDGIGGAARFDAPRSVVFGKDGNAYVTDHDNGLIRSIAPDGTVGTLAGSGVLALGDGVGPGASFNDATALAVDPTGALFVTEPGSSAIRRIDVATATVTTPVTASFGNQDGPVEGPVGPTGGGAAFGALDFLTADPSGDLFASDFNFGKVRRLHNEADGGWTASTWYSFSNGSGAFLTGVAADLDGGIYIANNNQAVFRLANTDGVLAEDISGSAPPGYVDGPASVSKLSTPQGLAVDTATGTVYVGDLGNDAIRAVQPDGGTWYTSTVDKDVAGVLGNTWGIAFDSASASVLAVEPNDDRVVRVHSDGTLGGFYGTPAVAGFVDDVGPNARFGFSNEISGAQRLGGVTLDPSSGVAYVADPYNNNIRAVTFDSSGVGTVATYAGNGAAEMPFSGFGNNGGYADGLLSQGFLNSPGGVAFDPVAGPMGTQATLWIADTGNNVVRAVTWDQSVGALVLVTPAGSIDHSCQDGGLGSDGIGPAASFCEPEGIAVDPSSGTVFVVDSGSNNIRMLQATGSDFGNYQVTTIGGNINGGCGIADGDQTTSRFCHPMGIAVADSRTVFVTDVNNNALRMVALGGEGQWITSTIGTPGRFNCTPADGVDAEIQLCNPSGVAVDSAGNVYVSERAYNSPQTGDIRKLTHNGTSWTSTTLVGVTGKRGVKLGALPAGLNQPTGMVIDPVGDLLVTDLAENALLRVRVPGNIVSVRGK